MRFVSLTLIDDTEVVVNTENITMMYRSDETRTSVYLVNDPEPLRVLETPAQILFRVYYGARRSDQ